MLKGLLSSEMGRFYSRVFSKRSTGDYEDFITHDASTVDGLLPDAMAFVDAIQSLVKQWLINPV